MKEAKQQRKGSVVQFVRGQFLARPGPVPVERGRWPVAAPWLLGSSDFKRPQLQHPRVAYLSTPRHLGRAILFLSGKDKAAFMAFSPAEWLRLAMPAGAPLTAFLSSLTTSLRLPIPQKIRGSKVQVTLQQPLEWVILSLSWVICHKPLLTK